MQGNDIPNILWLARHVSVAVFPSSSAQFSVPSRILETIHGYEIVRLNDQ